MCVHDSSGCILCLMNFQITLIITLPWLHSTCTHSWCKQLWQAVYDCTAHAHTHACIQLWQAVYDCTAHAHTHACTQLWQTVYGCTAHAHTHAWTQLWEAVLRGQGYSTVVEVGTVRRHFCVTNGEAVLLAFMAEGRNAAKHTAMHRIPPNNKELSNSNVNNYKVESVWFERKLYFL